MKKSLFIISLIIIVGFFATVYKATKDSKTGAKIEKEQTISVMVSILPQVDFVERIGGSKVKVSEMIPPGFSPPTYNPSPQQLQKLQDADIYFRIGHISFEKAQMGKLADINSKMKIIDTSEGISLLKAATHDHHDEEAHKDEHEEETVKEEEGNDPHIWLSPKLVKVQAQHIYNALVEHSPENKDYFTQNYNKFIKDLDRLDQKLVTTFAPIKGQTILVFHPAFGYLADAYSFSQEAIEIDGKEPTPAQLKETIDEAKKDNVKIIFVQAQFSTKSAKAIAQEIGGAVVQIDPLAKDYFTNLESMSEIITASLK